eukprot:jgi/Psemu1/285328/fgenesh1_pg.82_\
MSNAVANDSAFPETSLSSNDDAESDNDDTLGPTIHSRVEEDKLVLWQGIALLTADCVGVGILGLPNEVKLLGWAAGLSFLVLNCPINYYAGNFLSKLALRLEAEGGTSRVHGSHRQNHANDDVEVELATTAVGGNDASIVRRRFSNRKKLYQGLPQQQQEDSIVDETVRCDGDENDNDNYNAAESDAGAGGSYTSKNDRQTSDLINITAAVFSPNDTPTARSYVMLAKILYYANLFLVLGDYILVMSRSVAALFGEENICMPTAGVIASILMFGLCQFRTMANLGRSVSLASLLALLIVLVQCIFHHRTNSTGIGISDSPETRNMLENDNDDDGMWGKFSSLAGVGFAVGSQKLFLNIRHELKNREEASKVLAGSLSAYGSAYVAIVLLAGPDPPSFLFDSIPEGWGRRTAGLLLWFHVAVSYAINSQALCASLDHVLPTPANCGTLPSPPDSLWSRRNHPAIRWFGITLVVSISSYVVSNAIPFFKDLVALIGALTSVPLCLTLPAILHRRAKNIALLLPDRSCVSTGSYVLLLYSFLFLFIGLIGALSEIEEDWLNQGRPFSCH